MEFREIWLQFVDRRLSRSLRGWRDEEMIRESPAYRHAIETHELMATWLYGDRIDDDSSVPRGRSELEALQFLLVVERSLELIPLLSLSERLHWRRIYYRRPGRLCLRDAHYATSVIVQLLTSGPLDEKYFEMFVNHHADGTRTSRSILWFAEASFYRIGPLLSEVQRRLNPTPMARLRTTAHAFVNLLVFPSHFLWELASRLVVRPDRTVTEHIDTWLVQPLPDEPR